MGIYDRDYVRQERQGFHWGGDRSMVVNLIIVNVAIYVVDLLFDGKLGERLALAPDLPRHPLHFWQLLTNGFIHARDWRHVFWNMLIFWFFGRDVEGFYGRREFLRIYLTLIVLCSSVWVVVQNVPTLSDGGSPLAGASGAVTGVVILFVLHFPTRIIYLFGVVPIPAWVLGIIYVVGDVAGLGRSPLPGEPRIAYEVHLAGAALAFLYYQSGIRLGQFIPSDWSLGSFKFRPKLRVHDPEPRATGGGDLSSQVDRILEKISQHGQDSLTDKERQTLEDASRRYQRRRG